MIPDLSVVDETYDTTITSSYFYPSRQAWMDFLFVHSILSGTNMYNFGILHLKI